MTRITCSKLYRRYPPEMTKIVTFHVSENISILAQDDPDEPVD
ncbi:MAG: hypothetical protein ACKJSG_03080 [Lentisphaeria bacterium]